MKKLLIILVAVFVVASSGLLGVKLAIPYVSALFRAPVESKKFSSMGLKLEENAVTELISVIDAESGHTVFQFPVPPMYVVEEIAKDDEAYIVQFRKAH